VDVGSAYWFAKQNVQNEIAVPHELRVRSKFVWAKLIRFRQIWLDLGEIWAKVIKMGKKSCIPKNIRSQTVMVDCNLQDL